MQSRLAAVELLSDRPVQQVQPRQCALDRGRNRRSFTQPGDLGVHFPDHLADAARIQQRAVDRLLLVLERLELGIDALGERVQGLEIGAGVERQHLALREVAELAVEPLERAFGDRDQFLKPLGTPSQFLGALDVFGCPDLGSQHESLERRDSCLQGIDARRRLAHLFRASADLFEHLTEGRRPLLEPCDHARYSVGVVSLDDGDQRLEPLALGADAGEELLVPCDLWREVAVTLTSELRKEFHRCSGAGCSRELSNGRAVRHPR